MSASNLFVNSVSSFVGTIFGVGVIPYLKFLLVKSKKYSLKVEKSLSDLENIKNSVRYDQRIPSPYADSYEWSSNDVEKYKEINYKTKKIISILYKDRHNIRAGMYGKYGAAVNKSLEDIFSLYLRHEKNVSEMFHEACFGGYDTDEEINIYREFAMKVGCLAEEASKKIHSEKNGTWHNRIIRKIIGCFS